MRMYVAEATELKLAVCADVRIYSQVNYAYMYIYEGRERGMYTHLYVHTRVAECLYVR